MSVVPIFADGGGAMDLTLYYDGQFWVGVVEEAGSEGLRAYRHVFGAEPSDGEVLEFVKTWLIPLFRRASSAELAGARPPRPANPKRASREAARAVGGRGASTFAYEAIKADLESRKREGEFKTRQDREQEERRRFELARQKAKQRHRGH
jgi:hypothetical protein